MAGRLPQKAIGNRADSVLIQVESPGRFGNRLLLPFFPRVEYLPSLVSEKAEGTAQREGFQPVHEFNPLATGKNPRS